MSRTASFRTKCHWGGALGALALTLACAAPASADGIGDDSAPAQDICGICHGLDGVSRMSKFPRLAGQNAAYIEKQIHDFLDGRRRNDDGQMRTILTEFSEHKLREAAQYFANLAPPPPIAEEPDGSNAALARELFLKGDASRGIRPCADCHLPSGWRAATTGAPYLTSQHPDYLLKQLRDFSDGQRRNDATGTMAAIAKALKPEEMTALAHFLAATPRELPHAH